MLFSLGCVISGAAITFGEGAVFACTLFGVLVYVVILGAFFETSLERVNAVGEGAYYRGGVQAEETLSAIKA